MKKDKHILGMLVFIQVILFIINIFVFSLNLYGINKNKTIMNKLLFDQAEHIRFYHASYANNTNEIYRGEDEEMNLKYVEQNDYIIKFYTATPTGETIFCD